MRNPQSVLFADESTSSNLPERPPVPAERLRNGEPDWWCLCSSQAILGQLRGEPTVTCGDAPWLCPYAEISSTPTT